MTNVSAITAADMSKGVIDFSEILEYSLSKEKHLIQIKDYEKDKYTAYYQWLDVTSKNDLMKKAEDYNLAVADYEEWLKKYASASSEEKEAIDKELEKARVASLGAETAYYEQLTADGMYVNENFKETKDLDVSNPDMKEGHTYLLWVKVVTNVDGTTKEHYNHVYVHTTKAVVPVKEKEEKNPDTAMNNPYTYLVPLFLVTGVSALFLKNRYSH